MTEGVEAARAVHVGDRAAADGTVRTDRLVLARSGDLELARLGIGGLQVEAERADETAARGERGALQEIATGEGHRGRT
jgi:hypothetical protein